MQDEQRDETTGTAETESETRTDREDGGPTADESSGDDATGAGHGTRESGFDSHE